MDARVLARATVPRLLVAALSVLLVAATAACSGAAGGGSPSASPSKAASPAAAAVRQLPQICSEDEPCTYPAGRFRLGLGTVMERLVLTLPSAGWTSAENNPGELKLDPPGTKDEHLFVWADMVAVQSTGKGHGLTQLTKVGRSPAALLAWLDGNRDLTVRKLPDRTVAGIVLHGRSVTPSRTARYGDPACPSNPRCADLFTQGRFETDDSYGIGYPGIADVYIGGPLADAHTVLLALDAADPKGLAELETRVRPVLDSMTLSPS
jgi:hypothetical protein